MYQGTSWVLLKQKKRSRKSHAWAPLNMVQASISSVMDKPRYGQTYSLFGSFRWKLALDSHLAGRASQTALETATTSSPGNDVGAYLSSLARTATSWQE